MSNDKFWDYFYEIYEQIPRQGPGHRASTQRALRLLPPLAPSKRILDIGCGSGAQTIDLALTTNAEIVAVDNHAPFVAQLTRKAEKLQLSERLTAQIGDMNDLQFADESFDVIWSEGAVFIMGFAAGLRAWRRLLAPDGYMAISEFCWMEENPPARLRELFGDEGSDVGDVDARREAIRQSGYRLLADFVLPAAAWWENYYVPLSECLTGFRKKHAGNPEALAVADHSAKEIAQYEKHPGSFGYVFFVMQRDEGAGRDR